MPLAPGEALLLANASFWDAKREELRLDLAAQEVQVSWGLGLRVRG